MGDLSNNSEIAVKCQRSAGQMLGYLPRWRSFDGSKHNTVLGLTFKFLENNHEVSIGGDATESRLILVVLSYLCLHATDRKQLGFASVAVPGAYFSSILPLTVEDIFSLFFHSSHRNGYGIAKLLLIGIPKCQDYLFNFETMQFPQWTSVDLSTSCTAPISALG